MCDCLSAASYIYLLKKVGPHGSTIIHKSLDGIVDESTPTEAVILISIFKLFIEND